MSYDHTAVEYETWRDRHHTKLGAALYALLDRIDAGDEYPDAEHRIARRFGVNQGELRSAYDEFTADPADPAFDL